MLDEIAGVRGDSVVVLEGRKSNDDDRESAPDVVEYIGEMLAVVDVAGPELEDDIHPTVVARVALLNDFMGETVLTGVDEPPVETEGPEVDSSKERLEELGDVLGQVDEWTLRLEAVVKETVLAGNVTPAV